MPGFFILFFLIVSWRWGMEGWSRGNTFFLLAWKLLTNIKDERGLNNVPEKVIYQTQARVL